MNHNVIRHKLSDFMDNAVSDKEKSEIEEHLKTCPACREALAELRKTLEHVKAIEEVEPPGWMTQKIMAKVRSGAREQKTLLQRIFSFPGFRVPIQAVVVLFLAVTAFSLYRSIQPVERPALPPMRELAEKQEALQAPAAEGEQKLQQDTSRTEKKPLQTPEYKALDMKLAQEKPAPPVPTDQAMAPAPVGPAEQPAHVKKEAAVERNTIRLRVKAVAVAALKVEQVISRHGGAITKKEERDKKIIYKISISVQKFPEFKDGLKRIGETRPEAAPLASPGDRVEINIELSEGTGE